MIFVRRGDLEREHMHKQQDVINMYVQKNSDLIEYLSMMTDVEIPEEEAENYEQEV